MLFSSHHQQYIDLWQLGCATKRLETHSSFLYWLECDAAPVVLKIYKPNSDEAPAAELLKHYNGYGAVRILQNTADACLLAQVGTGAELVELTRAGNDAQATEIFCEVVKKLHSAPKTDIGLKPIDDFVQDFDDYLAQNDLADRALVTQARQVYVELAATQGQKLNLHGDLHHYNMLQADNGDWLAIDPKGLWGEAEYEIGRYLINPLGEDYHNIDLQLRLEIIDQQLGFNMQRVKKWAFSQAVMTTFWAGNQREFDAHVKIIISIFKKLS